MTVAACLYGQDERVTDETGQAVEPPPSPQYVVIDLGIYSNFGFAKVVANNGWILSSKNTRWEWGDVTTLTAGVAASLETSDMNNSGEVIGKVSSQTAIPSRPKIEGAFWPQDAADPVIYVNPSTQIWDNETDGWKAHTGDGRSQFTAIDDFGLIAASTKLYSNHEGPTQDSFRFQNGQAGAQLRTITEGIDYSTNPPNTPISFGVSWGVERVAKWINSGGDMLGIYKDYGSKNELYEDWPSFKETGTFRIKDGALENLGFTESQIRGINDGGVVLTDSGLYENQLRALPFEFSDYKGLSSPEVDAPLYISAREGIFIQKEDTQTGNLIAFTNPGAFWSYKWHELIGNDDEWSDITRSAISDNGNCIAAKATKAGVKHTVLLLKVDIRSDPNTGPEEFRNKFIDRFKPERNWDNEEEREDLARQEPLYAREGTGDQVRYKAYIPSIDTSLITNYRWWAEGVDEYNYITEDITGPKGATRDEWLIEADDLDWTPGKYKIKLEVTFASNATATTEYEQEIGWRTPELVSIGQILPFDTHDLSFSEIIAFRYHLLKGAISLSGNEVGLDLSDTAVASALSAIAALSPVPSTTKRYLELYSGITLGVENFSSIPTGPLEGVNENMYLWALQTLLCDNSDEDLVMPDSFERSFLSNTVLDPDALFFRIFSVFKADLLVDENFKIVEANPTYSSEYPSKSLVENGPTKLNLGVVEGELFEGGKYLGVEIPPIPWDDVVYNLRVESERSGETGLKPNHESMYSLYGSARIGEEGQRLNFGLTGYDAPWIYIEPIFIADAQNHEITFELRTSVDMVVDEQGSVFSGECPFNEIKLYKRNYGNSEGGDTFLFERILTLPLENSLECFIESAPFGIRPAPKTTSHLE